MLIFFSIISENTINEKKRMYIKNFKAYLSIKIFTIRILIIKNGDFDMTLCISIYTCKLYLIFFRCKSKIYYFRLNAALKIRIKQLQNCLSRHGSIVVSS